MIMCLLPVPPVAKIEDTIHGFFLDTPTIAAELTNLAYSYILFYGSKIYDCIGKILEKYRYTFRERIAH